MSSSTRSSASRTCPRVMRGDKGAMGTSAIVQKPFHVFDNGSECLRANGGGVAIERHHVVAPGRPILKHEDLAPAVGTKVEQLVASAAQETREIEVACFERAL